MAAEIRQSPPTVVAVHGGDGTLHKTVTALGRAFGADPLPPIAILCGGTMNVVATSLRIRERPSVFLTAIVEADRSGQPLETIRRRCLRIGDELGFLFGNGLPANFLAEYYAPSGYGPGARSLVDAARAFFSALVARPVHPAPVQAVRGLGPRRRRRCSSRPAFVGLMARDRARGGPGLQARPPRRRRPGALRRARHAFGGAVAGARRPGGADRARHRARRAFSAVASQMDIQPKNGSMAYTIDGDLYRTHEPLAISLGPHIDFLKPPSALIVRPRGDTMVGQR